MLARAQKPFSWAIPSNCQYARYVPLLTTIPSLAWQQNAISLLTCRRSGGDVRQGPSLEENFRDCLFRVVAKQEFQARTALRKAERHEQELRERTKAEGGSMIKTKPRRRGSVATHVRERFAGGEADPSEEEQRQQELAKAKSRCEELRMRVTREQQRNEQSKHRSKPVKFTAQTVQLQVCCTLFSVHMRGSSHETAPRGCLACTRCL